MSEHTSSPGNSEENPPEFDFDDTIDVQFPDFMEDATPIPTEEEVAARRIMKIHKEQEILTGTYTLAKNQSGYLGLLYESYNSRIGKIMSVRPKDPASTTLQELAIRTIIMNLLLGGDTITLADVEQEVMRTKPLKNVSNECIRTCFVTQMQEFLDSEMVNREIS